MRRSRKPRSFPGRVLRGVTREVLLTRDAIRRFSLSDFAFFLIALVAAVAPWPLASIEWRFLALWAMIIGIAAPFLDVSALRASHLEFLKWTAGAAILVGLYALLQAAPSIGPMPENRVWQMSRDILRAPLTGSISVAPAQTLLVAGALALHVLLFFAAFVAGAQARRARFIVMVVLFSGVANAVIGWLLFQMDPRQLLWMEFQQPRGQPSGTFPNRNHASTMFAACGTGFLAMALSRAFSVIPSGGLPFRSAVQVMLFRPPPHLMLPLAGTMICFVLTVVTLSRAGLAVFLFGAFLAFAVLSWRSFKAAWGTVVVAGVALFGLFVLARIGIGRFGDRFVSQQLAQDERFDAYRAMARMVLDHFWFGVGLGNFELAFPAYRTTEMSSRLVWEYAHSSPLQLIIELGLPMGLLAAALPLAIIGVCFVGALNRKRDADLPLIGAVFGTVGFAHSTVDFSLQIPGFGLAYAAVLGAATAQSFRTSQQSR